MGGGQSFPKEKHIVIVGGGYGGVTLASKLKASDANFTLINATNTCHLNLGSVRAAVNLDFARKTLLPLDKAFGEKFRHGKVTSIDVTSKKVVLESGDEVNYDILVIATGSGGNFPNKINQSKTLESAMEDYKALIEKLTEAKRVLIIGGGPSGVEQAGEVAAQFPDKEVTIVHNRDGLIDDKVTQGFKDKLEGIVKRYNIKLVLGERVADIEKYTDYTMGPVTVLMDSGKEIQADLVFKCTGLWTNSAAYKESLSDCVGEFDRLRVDEFLAVKGKEDIYAIGDCSDCKDPKLAFAATHQAIHVFENFKKSLNQLDRVPYRADALPVVMVISVGPLAGTGLTKSGWNLPEFLVRNLKCKDLAVSKYWKDAGLKMP